MLDRDGQVLRDELLSIIGRGADRSLDDTAFDHLALRIFAYNHDRVPAYAAYCRARGVGPGTARSWTEIPPVPTAAFKEMTLVPAGARVERVFRTSGTTLGPERRGEHHVPDIGLYQASLRATFAAFLLSDGASLPFLSLVPDASAQPDSSLAFMVTDLRAHYGAAGGGTFADQGGLDMAGLEAAVAAAVADRTPLMLLGTSAAFIHWLDRLARDGRRYALPDGSRLMDTGGFKGAGRQVAPRGLRQAYGDRLGLPEQRCVNEYGMTEMLSQLYDTGLADHQSGRSRPPRKAAPPWVRSVAVDPETLRPLPPGERGLLRHVDLANMGSVASIQTEDIGFVDEHGLFLEGRAPGAPPRGCSIAMDLLLRETR
jgi:hypothetical protein